MAETPKTYEYRVETGSRFSWDSGPDEARFRLEVVMLLLGEGIQPASMGEDGNGRVLDDEHVFGDFLVRLTEDQAERLRELLAQAAGEAFPYEDRQRLVVRADQDDLRD